MHPRPAHPNDPVAALPSESERSAAPDQAAAAATLLVVDDHELVGTSLVLGLRSEGLTARRCRPNGHQAVLTAAAEQPPGLVLLDLDLGLGSPTLCGIGARG